MKLIILLVSILLTGCASGCREACVFGFGPGNSLFDSYANYADKSDPCQFVGKPEGYELPGFCGASKGKVVRVQRYNNSYIVHK